MTAGSGRRTPHADVAGTRPRLPRGFVVLLGVSTLTAMSSGAVTPVIPRFVRGELAGDESLVGLTVAVTALFGLVSGLLAGPHVDRRGRRGMAVCGLIVALAGSLLLVPASGVGQTLVARSVYGVGAGVAAVAIMTWAVDEISPERRGRALSTFGTTVWLGLSAGPQLGQLVYGLAGFRGVWLLIASLEGLALLLVLLLPAHRSPPLARGPAVGSFWQRLVPLGAVRPGIAIALAAYGEGVITAFLVLHLVDRGVQDGAGFGGAASVYTIFAASVLLLRLLAGGRIDAHRPRRVAGVALILEATGLVVLAEASSFGAAAIGAATMGSGFAVLFPCLALLATRESSPHERGAALGAFGSSFSLGLALGGLVGGPVASLGGTGAAHLSGAAAAGIAVLVLMLGSDDPRSPRSDGPEADIGT